MVLVVVRYREQRVLRCVHHEKREAANMKKQNIRFSVKSQLFLFLTLFILIILVSDVFVFVSFGRTLRETSVEINSKTLEMIRSDAEMQLENVEALADSLRRESSIIAYVSAVYSDLAPEEQMIIRNEVTQKMFNSVVLQETVVSNCCLIQNEDDYIILNRSHYGLINKDFIAAALEEVGGRQTSRIISIESGGKHAYCYYFSVYPNRGDGYGKLLFVLNERMFGSIFNKYRMSDVEMFCTDMDGNIVFQSTYYSPEINEEELEAFSPNSISVVDEKEWLYMGTQIVNSPLCLHLRIPYNIVMQNMYKTMRLDIIFVGVIVVLLTVVCLFFVQRLYRRINKLQDVMNHISNGELNYRYTSRRSDEISDIGYHINDMVSKINSLVIESAKKELAVKKAQFRSVQMQINPHFLFNTLETIRMMALYRNETHIARVVKDLSDLFRYTIVSSNPIVSIDDELNQTLKYLELQKNRAKNQFDVEIDVDPIVLDYTLLRLVLQPLVENALTHGIEPKFQHGALKIGIHLEEGRVEIVVEDTGAGMTPEKLDSLRKMIRGEIAPPKNDEHIGLYNVYERLTLFFGRQTQMEIESVAGQGTKVTLQIPAVRYSDKLTADNLREIGAEITEET